MFLTDNDRKKLSIKTKKIIEETLKKNKKVNNKNLFDIWSSIALETEINFEGTNFVEMNKPWGYNYSRIRAYLYNNFIKEYRGNFEWKNFEKKIFDLLNLSKKNSIQSTGKERKHKIKQKVFPDEMNEGDWCAPSGEDVKYSNSKKIKNPYSISYFRNTKIPFFKGPQDQEKFILSKKWNNFYTCGFIYGFISAWQNYVFINWKEVRKDSMKNLTSKVKLVKSKIDKNYANFFLNRIYINYLTKHLKIKDNIAESLFLEIQKSIYDSNLSLYLYAKKDNYFTFRSRKFERTLDHHYEQVGTQEFYSGILANKELYLGKTENGRFYNTVLNTRIDARKNDMSGHVYNYEQFLMYTMSLEFLPPLDFNKLKIDEKDIFLRFAINRGKDEFLDYVECKVF